MAITYTTDLTLVSSANSTSDAGTWSKTGSTQNPAIDGDSKVEGANCMTQKTGATTGATDTGATLVLTATFNATSKCVYHWRNYTTASNMETKANLGTSVLFSSDTAYNKTNYKQFTLDGNDTDSLGGWRCYVVDPSLAATASAGTYNNAAIKTLGFLHRQLTSVGTTIPNQYVDVIRVGTGLTATASSAADTITLAGIYAYDSNNARAWGVVTSNAGIFFGAGKILIGSSSQSNTCLYKDTNKVLVWKDYPVAATFYTIDGIGNTGQLTTIQWGEKDGSNNTTNGCSIQVQGSAKWNMLAGSNSRFLMYGSSFFGLNSATWNSSCEARNSTFSACSTITAASATIAGCNFLSPVGTQIKLAQPAEFNSISYSTFVSSGTGYAVEIGGTAANITVNNNNFNGYAAYQAGGTTTGNEAIFVNIASGSMTITISGGNTPSFRTAGATVTVVSGATVTFTGLPTGTDIVILTAGTTTILQQVDQNSGTSYAWGYSGTPTVDVGFIKPGYKVEYLRNLALTTSDTSIPVNMRLDPTYV